MLPQDGLPSSGYQHVSSDTVLPPPIPGKPTHSQSLLGTHHGEGAVVRRDRAPR